MSTDTPIVFPDWIEQATREDTANFITELDELGANNPSPLSETFEDKKAMVHTRPEDMVRLYQLGTQFLNESTTLEQKCKWGKFLDKIEQQWDWSVSWEVGYQEIEMLAFPEQFHDQTHYH